MPMEAIALMPIVDEDHVAKEHVVDCLIRHNADLGAFCRR